MKNKIIFLSIILFIFSSHCKAYEEIDYKVSKNYEKIFNEKILSNKDIGTYQKIFLFQKDCDFKNANKKILKLKNNILMGHVLAQRYLHPDCYRSKFLELSSWLKMYNDHPQARRIYRLAIRRMPEGYKSPPKPKSAIGIKVNNSKNANKNNKYESAIKLNKSKRREKYQLIINIKSRVNKGWPTGALKILNQSKTNKLLDSVEIDKQKELIAKGYFLASKNKLAVKYANEALERSSEHVPFANWTAGLASWKLQNYKDAINFFTNFAIALENDPWHHSSGSFWAARSYGELKNFEKVNSWLNLAAKNNEAFYGQLANSILGTNNLIEWKNEKNPSDIKENFSDLPAGKRIMALIQIGRAEEAEKEIIKLNTNVNESVALISLEIAKEFNFAQTQLKIAYKLSSIGKNVPIKYFYPVPGSIPNSSYILDKALVLAFIHQESNFNAKAKSRRGAIGLMQIMPNTAKFISNNKEIKRGNIRILQKPLVNIQIGQEYISYLLNLNIVNNNLIYMAAAYNGGPGNLKKWMEETDYNNDALLFMESINSRETRWFIEKILTNYWIYQQQFDENPFSLIELASGRNPMYNRN